MHHLRLKILFFKKDRLYFVNFTLAFVHHRRSVEKIPYIGQQMHIKAYVKYKNMINFIIQITQLYHHLIF
jgi:hypothetical protein